MTRLLAWIRRLYAHPEPTGWGALWVNCTAREMPQPPSFTFPEAAPRVAFYQVPDSEDER